MIRSDWKQSLLTALGSFQMVQSRPFPQDRAFANKVRAGDVETSSFPVLFPFVSGFPGRDVSGETSVTPARLGHNPGHPFLTSLL